MDAVLLSAFAKVKPGEDVLDLCTGTGVLPILMEAKTEGRSFTGLEIQEEVADMASRSVRLNHLTSRVRIVCGDLKKADAFFAPASFDVITCNPPYMPAESGRINPKDTQAVSRHEIACTLEDVLSCAKMLLRDSGRFYMVHRPFRLTEIMVLMHEYKLEPKRMQLVYSFADKEPNMVLIEGARGGKSRITVEKPLIIYEAPGKYTAEIYDIYGY